VEPARCPSCHAAVAARAGWCTLCFADLRPAAEPAVAVAATASPPVAPVVASAAAAVPQRPTATDPTPLLESPALDATATRPPAGGAGAEQPEHWPCLSCGADVPLALDACPDCGAAFLAGSDEPLSLKVPVVGDLARANPGLRFVVGLGAAAVLCGVFLLVMLVLGKLL